jgi:hypothetical protein
MAVLVLVLAGGTTALAGKKKPKPPKAPTGTYLGTTSEGIPMTIVLNRGRASGSITYCNLTAPITVARGRTFSVSHVDPVTLDTISATGSFRPKKRRVGGTVAANGCSSNDQTFLLAHP